MPALRSPVPPWRSDQRRQAARRLCGRLRRHRADHDRRRLGDLLVHRTRHDEQQLHRHHGLLGTPAEGAIVLKKDGTEDRNTLSAIVDGSTITAATGVSVKATSSQTIEALAIGGALDGVVRRRRRSHPRRRRRRHAELDQGRRPGRRFGTAARRHDDDHGRGRRGARRARRRRFTPDAGGVGILLKIGDGGGVNLSFGVGVAINELARHRRGDRRRHLGHRRLDHGQACRHTGR